MTIGKPSAKKTIIPAKTRRFKGERLAMRIDKSTKSKLERAAAYSHKSVSDYVVSQALAAAEADIQTQESLVLSPLAWGQFFEAFKNPPKPTTALKALLKAHDQTIWSR